jgi:hypothetical protein
MTGFVQQSWPSCVSQSLSALQVFAQVEAQSPLQQSSWPPALLVQSLSWVQATGHSEAGVQAPAIDDERIPFGSARWIVVQQSCPAAVLQLALVAQATGHASVAVQTGVEKSAQHFGVPPAQSLSAAQVTRHWSAGAQTVSVELGFVMQHASPADVLQVLSLEQKIGVTVPAGTQALPEEP